MSLDFYEDLKSHLQNVQNPSKSLRFGSKVSPLTSLRSVANEIRSQAEQSVRTMRDEGNTVSKIIVR